MTRDELVDVDAIAGLVDPLPSPFRSRRRRRAL